MVLESDFGIRQQTEQFYPLTEADWTRINRNTIGFTVGQFHPELNPRNVIPKVTFNVPNSPNFTFDNRLVDQGEAWLTSFRTSLTSIRGSHSLKGGYYFELSQNSEGKGGVGAGPWAGQFNFSTDVNNPLDTNYSYANALLGTFRDYTEIDAFSEVVGKRYINEFYAQDTWKASRRLTVDYGVRFLWYTPWYSTPAGVGFRSRTLRSGQGAAALSAGGGQRRERRVRSGHESDAAERVRRQLRSRNRRSLQRDGHQQRSELPEGLPRQPGHRARAARGHRVGPGRRRKDRDPRQRRAVSQPARQRERHGRDGEESSGAEHAEHLLRDDGHAAGRGGRRARSRIARAPCSASSATRRRRRASTTRPASSASLDGAR